ncbi:MAG: hypothetical protein ACKODL_01085 [Phenylobacterium sp.]
MIRCAAALVVLSLAAGGTALARPAPISLCRPAETVIFAYSVGARIVSVCAAEGAVQYRFGRPGGPPELKLPDPAGRPAAVATGDTLVFAGGGGAWLRFASGPYAYTVYSAIGRWGRGGAPAEKAGLLVEKDGARLRRLPCTGPDTGLDSGWMAAAGVRSGGWVFDLP